MQTANLPRFQCDLEYTASKIANLQMSHKLDYNVLHTHDNLSKMSSDISLLLLY